LRVARALRGKPVDVVLIDRNNYHTFQPLLYEVATAGLEPADIAQPVRAILQGRENVRFRMAEVERIDLEARIVVTDAGDERYDFLVVAAGSETSFFDVGSAAEHALVLKDLHQATAIRNRVIRSFERATAAGDEDERARLMTTVIIGGGPTGVELAGALAELKRHVLPRDYPELDLSQARVILIEATDRLLAAMPPRLQRKAALQLRELGVEVRLDSPVAAVDPRGVALRGGERIDAANVIWVAGVRGEGIATAIDGVPLAPGRRVRVDAYLRLPGHPEAHGIGDLAHLAAPDGKPYPMVAPVAMQEGELVAENILRGLRGEPARPFRYRDRGTMATIGRRKAVAHVFGLQFHGLAAWVLWLVVHLLGIIGLRNRALVLLNWTWNYFRYDRANRLVTDRPEWGALEQRRSSAGERVEAPLTRDGA
jgi:NADH dehydrogenase